MSTSRPGLMPLLGCLGVFVVVLVLLIVAGILAS